MAAEPKDWSDAESSQLRDKACSKYRGMAIIAIFHTFQDKDLNIKYADEDRKLLEDGFHKLQYGVVVWDDTMTKKQFFQRLELISLDPIHKTSETFAMVIITHGDKEGNLKAYDQPFHQRDVFSYFNDENCNGLKNKLKLFIIHACLGNNFGEGVLASGQTVTDEFPCVKIMEKVQKDYLILFSTFEGNAAFGPLKGEGSLFISALCEVLERESHKNETKRKHILTILTEVIRITASKDFDSRCIIKQQPTLIMSMRKLHYFNDKKEKFPEEILQRYCHRLNQATKC